MRDEAEPTVDEHGDETHPAFGLIGVSRLQVGGVGGGAVLFDSEIRHGHTIRVRIYSAVRSRDLHRDRVHTQGRMPIVEVELSEAQFASFVSSGGVGDGVPCTIRARDGRDVPDIPYAPRMQHSLGEVRGAAEEAIAAVREAFEAYDAKRNAENRRRLKYAIANLPANMEFAAKSLVEHAENTTEKMRADVEAMVTAAAQQLGIGEDEARALMPPEDPGGG